MRKLRTFLGLLLAATTVFGVAGCRQELSAEEKAQIEKIQAIKDNIGKLSPILINDFEQPKDFYVLQGGDQSGVYVGKEMAHSGKQSAKVWSQPDDNPWSGNASFSMPLKTGWRGDFSDISLIKSISFWVYNAQDEERTVTCKMELPSGASVKFSEELPGNAWTQVFYDLKREQIPSPRCETMIFAFEGNLGHESIYYIDDIVFYKSTQGVQRENVTLQQDEVLFFDNATQVRNIASHGGGGGSALVASVEQSSFTPTGRGSSMLITAPGGTEHYNTSRHWPAVQLYNVSYTPWAYYDMNDELCFDYYIPEEGGFREIWFHVYAYGTQIYNKPVALKKGQWVTYSIPVKSICNGRNKESSFDGINQLAFCWGELNAPGETFQIYIDNIRMKVNKGE